MDRGKVFEWHQPLDMRELCVPIKDCVTVKLGPVDPNVMALLESRGYDQAPVVTENNGVCGLVTTNRLKRLFAIKQPLHNDDPELQDVSKEMWGSEGVRLDYLLLKLAKARAALLQDEYDGGEYGTAVFIHGLITISDLNRHAFRALLYRMVSVLEVELARLIEKRFSEPWDWLKHLNEDAQVNVLGYWQLSEKRGVSIGPFAATNFTHLLQIVERTSPLLKELGYASATDFKQCRGRMCRLRNDVMHPIRPLILSTEDVEALCEIIGNIINLGQRVTSLLEEHPRTPEPAQIVPPS